MRRIECHRTLSRVGFAPKHRSNPSQKTARLIFMSAAWTAPVPDAVCPAQGPLGDLLPHQRHRIPGIKRHLMRAVHDIKIRRVKK